MSDPMQITRLIERVLRGEIRVPGFQRDFVWEPDRAALLMDSIYKEYPFGSILLWRTRNQLKTEKKLGTFELPEPEADYPIDYVLDGQQRITSIFSTFQTALPSSDENPEVWLPIYYDFGAKADAQDSQFQALPKDQVDATRHFPLSVFFDPVEFAAKQREYKLTDDQLREIVTVQSKFSGVLIPVETFSGEDRASVAIVFERVNRQGVQLDTFQLLTAWTWSEEFDLQEKFKNLAERFESFGFEDVGTDNDLMLKCAATVLRGDPSPTALIDINGAEVRDKFDVIVKALDRTVDFLRDELQVRHLKFLPYAGLLIPLCAYFSRKQSTGYSETDSMVLKRWFWRTVFTHRYSGNPSRNIKRDVLAAIELREENQVTLDKIDGEIGTSFYLDNAFNNRTVATRAFILQIAAHGPRSFISGKNITLDDVLSEPNRREYHHCFPRAFIGKAKSPFDADVSCLANFAFLNRSENREISDKAPSLYREMMANNVDEILASQVIHPSLFDDEFNEFVRARATMLMSDAANLMDLSN
ncbi:GmrSD restriction endonuclease domain-containing protein [Mycolicibacterium sp. CBM1]